MDKRKLLIAGNWKMNLTSSQAAALAESVANGLPSAGTSASAEVVVCPAFVHLAAVANALKGSRLGVGAQNVSEFPDGAFTGEISAAMLSDLGVRFAIIGHSERRHSIQNPECDWSLAQKVRAAQAGGLTPIVCVGETLAQRDARETMQVLTFQLTAALACCDLAPTARLAIAYEPVWAIGTGRNASAEQAQEAHAHLRSTLRTKTAQMADQTPILYGGSVKPENARPLISQPDVDGALIGGASLKAESFLGILRESLAAKA